MASLAVPTIAVNNSSFPMNGHSEQPTLRSQPSDPSRAARPASASAVGKKPAYDFTYETFEYNNIVYVFRGYGVLVAATPTLEEAIDTAIQEFPNLSTVPREDIAICYETACEGKTVHWRISESAWATSARKFGPRTRLHIAVRGEDPMAGPLVRSQPSAEKALPPPYEETRAEKQRSRSASPGLGMSAQSISSFFKRF